MQVRSLDSWIRKKIEAVRSVPPFSRAALAHYQLYMIQRTVDYACTHSRFYRDYLNEWSGKRLQSWEDVAHLPFTTAEHLYEQGLKLVCVSLGDIERVVTLDTSGTVARPKRLYFSRGDIASTVEFFRNGLTLFVSPPESAAVLLPADREGSAGDLVRKALQQLSVTAIVPGPVVDPQATLKLLGEHRVSLIIGIPTQVLALARSRTAATLNQGAKTVIPCSDYVSEAIVEAIHEAWGCLVVSHYGSTEMGLGGGIECRFCRGYHFREADLYVEIVDPETGTPVPDGEYGEVVFTTLTRTGMPLIRYRTGDRAKFFSDPCPCGTVLKRMERVRRRVDGLTVLRDGGHVTMADLDEALFRVPGVDDFEAILTREERETLHLRFSLQTGSESEAARGLQGALLEVPVIAAAVAGGSLAIGDVSRVSSIRLTNSPAKRTISDQRKLLSSPSGRG